MGSVFVLLHADLEDDIYIRGIFTTFALAEEALRWDEDNGMFFRRRHHDLCCSVVEREVLDEPPPVLLGPEALYAADPGKPLFPDVIADMTIAMAVRPFPVWDKFRG